MHTKRYTNGVEWLKEHGFVAQKDDPVPYCNWMKNGVEVVFLVNSSDWCAVFNGWMGEYCDTPESAIRNLQEACRQQRDEILKKAQSYGEAVEHLDKALEKEKKDENQIID